MVCWACDLPFLGHNCLLVMFVGLFDPVRSGFLTDLDWLSVEVVLMWQLVAFA